MEEKYKRYVRGFSLVCILLFATFVIPLNNKGPKTVDARLITAREPTITQQAIVTLYTFERGRTRQYQTELAPADAEELTALMIKWADAQRAIPRSEVADQWKDQLLNALNQHWALPIDAVTSIVRCSSLSLSRYEQRKTVFRASITSSGSGLLVPMFLAPRPRLITIWKADSGKTLATNYITKSGYNATGPHLGVAVGFIGVGFSSRVASNRQYVMVGGALIAVLFGDSITPIVP